MFKDKVVFITGGSSGIGREAALLFAHEGAHVAITYKSNKEGAEDTLAQITKQGNKGLVIGTDLANDDEAERAVQRVVETFGRIDILVNNAGRYVEGDLWEGSSNIWIQSLRQNLVSVMSVSKYVISEFEKQQSGIIVNVASRHGMSGQYDALSYAASKAGVINITQAYAKLLSPYGRANAVSPSATQAGYWLTAPKDELEATIASRPNHKLVDPKTVAEKIVFLASDAAANINGENIQVTE